MLVIGDVAWVILHFDEIFPKYFLPVILEITLVIIYQQSYLIRICNVYLKKKGRNVKMNSQLFSSNCIRDFIGIFGEISLVTFQILF